MRTQNSFIVKVSCTLTVGVLSTGDYVVETTTQKSRHPNILFSAVTSARMFPLQLHLPSVSKQVTFGQALVVFVRWVAPQGAFTFSFKVDIIAFGGRPYCIF
ncbi:hypothetical protein Nepgr_014047 [Nepenthes gracilis]|uniref:Uncharacterized protein n=1 Tax=Nepenthes gracilis TaxID=150966 RepID=A0AAD3SKU7_NEPGR|nr:hypothetical protein Nepgr_014047 [Nepenthes gracilis]